MIKLSFDDEYLNILEYVSSCSRLLLISNLDNNSFMSLALILVHKSFFEISS